MIKCDVLLVGYAVNSTSGGYTNADVRYIDTVGIKYLYSHFYGTYCAEPLAFLQLAAEMRGKGLQTEILDGLILGYTREELAEALKKYDAKVYCFSLYESSKRDVILLMKYVKELNPNAKIITGGPYVTLCYRELIESEKVIDYIVIGDGDHAMPSLINRIINAKDERGIPNVVYRDNGKAVLDVAPIAIDMDTLLEPARDYVSIIENKGYSLSMATSRGCGHAACAFCYLPQYQKNANQPKFRYRSPELVVDEIERLIANYKIEKLTFVDDDFFGTDTVGFERAKEIFKLIIQKGIKIKIYVNARVKSILKLLNENLLPLAAQAGVKYFFIGLESYNDNILKKYHKGITKKDIDCICNALKEYGIMINPGMITFDRDITIHEVKNNIDLLRRIEYYDVFMFTRTLMQLPSDDIAMKDNRIKTGDFLHRDTEVLYNALVNFRDRLYKMIADVRKDKVSDCFRNRIIDLHYEFFYSVYNTISLGCYESIDTLIIEFSDRAENIFNENS